LRTFLVTIVLLLVYAFAVQATEFSLEKPLDKGRQANLVRVLRLLAYPDLVTHDDVTGSLELSETSRITLERIVETIFMALMASTVGTILAVPVSFIAARNLMEPVTAPLAAIGSAMVALPIGGSIFWLSSAWLIRTAESAFNNNWIGLLILLAILPAFWAIMTLGPAVFSSQRRRTTERLVAGVRILMASALVIFGMGILSQLGLDVGQWLESRLGSFGFLGNFIFILSDLIKIAVPAFLGLIGAIMAATTGMRYGQEAVLSLAITPARLVTAVAAALGVAVLVYGIGSALNWLYQFDNPQNWTWIPSLAAAGIGAVVGSFIRPKHPWAIGFALYTVSRSILNMLRSIEPLIMGIVFVVWVSLGPFAGVMALTLHSIAALGKLFSEQVEGISEGPVEALTATGANRLQTIVFAVVPQIIPPYIAFTLYRWDINVRMSTIIGFVGGGGIGFVLSQTIQQLRYRQASVMMLAIAIVVSTLDYVSSNVRKRII